MPLPGSSARCSSSQPSRLRASGSRSTPRRSDARASGPRMVTTPSRRPPARRRPAARRCRSPPGCWRWRWWPAPGSRPAADRSARGAGGSPGGSRAPSRRCSAPRRPPASRPGDQLGQLLVPEGRVVEPLRRDQQHVDLVSPSFLATSSHSCWLAELIATARTPARAAAATWSRISASSGETRIGGAGTSAAQQQGGHEIDGGLAPPGALHHQGAAAPSTSASIASNWPSWNCASARPTRVRRMPMATDRVSARVMGGDGGTALACQQPQTPP